MSFTNPFANPAKKKEQTSSNQTPKIDATRENVKKQLINALEKNKDNSIQNLVKTSEQIAIEIEQEIYEQNDNSAKNRGYRDKIRKLEMRIKGMRNNYIREILKKGELSVKEFCNLDEKNLNDENFFKKFQKSGLGDTPQPTPNMQIKKNNFSGKIPSISKVAKPHIMPKNIISSIRPVIPKPIIAPPVQENTNEINIEKEDNIITQPQIEEQEIKNEKKEEMINKKKEENIFNKPNKNLIINKPPSKLEKIETNEINNIKISGVNEIEQNDNNIEIGGINIDMGEGNNLLSTNEPEVNNNIDINNNINNNIDNNINIKNNIEIYEKPPEINNVEINNIQENINLNNNINIEQEKEKEKENDELNNSKKESQLKLELLQEKLKMAKSTKTVVKKPKKKGKKKKKDTTIDKADKTPQEEKKEIKEQIEQKDDDIFKQKKLSDVEKKEIKIIEEKKEINNIEIKKPEEKIEENNIQIKDSNNNKIFSEEQEKEKEKEKEKIFPNSCNNLDIMNIKHNINKEIIANGNQENILEDFSNSYSIINDNTFREKYKLLNKTKISLENELEFIKSENNTLKTEISKMKQMISDLRMQNSQSNEELLKLEIDSLKIELNKRITEIQNLKQEKQSMLYKINMYEKKYK